MSDRPDFAKVRINSADEWKLIRETYAETYPVRPLVNHVDELRTALQQIMDLKRQPFEDPFAWQERARRIAKIAVESIK